MSQKTSRHNQAYSLNLWQVEAHPNGSTVFKEDLIGIGTNGEIQATNDGDISKRKNKTTYAYDLYNAL